MKIRDVCNGDKRCLESQEGLKPGCVRRAEGEEQGRPLESQEGLKRPPSGEAPARRSSSLESQEGLKQQITLPTLQHRYKTLTRISRRVETRTASSPQPRGREPR